MLCFIEFHFIEGLKVIQSWLYVDGYEYFDGLHFQQLLSVNKTGLVVNCYHNSG